MRNLYYWTYPLELHQFCFYKYSIAILTEFGICVPWRKVADLRSLPGILVCWFSFLPLILLLRLVLLMVLCLVHNTYTFYYMLKRPFGNINLHLEWNFQNIIRVKNSIMRVQEVNTFWKALALKSVICYKNQAGYYARPIFLFICWNLNTITNA